MYIWAPFQKNIFRMFIPIRWTLLLPLIHIHSLICFWSGRVAKARVCTNSSLPNLAYLSRPIFLLSIWSTSMRFHGWLLASLINKARSQPRNLALVDHLLYHMVDSKHSFDSLWTFSLQVKSCLNFCVSLIFFLFRNG